MEKKQIKDFFTAIIESGNSSEINSPTAIKEQDYLFNDPMSDVDSFVRLEELKIKIKKTDSHRDMREKNAKLAFNFSAIWAVFIGIIILLYGFGRKFDFFEMSETAFIFIIGSLTFSILAFYTIVLTFLFKSKKCICNK